MTSSTVVRSSSGTLSSAARTIVAARSSGRTLVSDPLWARPMALRAVETMTASGMTGSSVRAVADRRSTPLPVADIELSIAFLLPCGNRPGFGTALVRRAPGAGWGRTLRTPGRPGVRPRSPHAVRPAIPARPPHHGRGHLGVPERRARARRATCPELAEAAPAADPGHGPPGARRPHRRRAGHPLRVLAPGRRPGQQHQRPDLRHGQQGRARHGARAARPPCPCPRSASRPTTSSAAATTAPIRWRAPTSTRSCATAAPAPS